MNHTAETAGGRDETPELPQPWLKLHPLTPVIDGGLALVIIVGILVANLRDVIINMFIGDRWTDEFDELEGSQEEAWNPVEFIFSGGYLFTAIAVVAGIILLGLGIAWLSWYFHSYQINDRAVEMKKGVFVKKHRRAPLERIQSVNLQRPLMARLFGLTKIEVQTGGADGSLNLAYLAHNEAKRVRQQILRTASGAYEESSTHNGGVRGGGVPPTDFVSEIDRRAKEFVDDDIEADSPESIVAVPHGRLIASILLSHEAIFVYLAVIAIPIVAAFVGWGVLAGLIPAIIAFTSILISRFNRGFNFKLSSAGNGVRTGSGLTSTSTDTVPRHRIHAVDVSQPIWWRPFGWWRIRLTTAGGVSPSSSNNQKVLENVVLPVGTREDVANVLALLSPVLADEGERHWILDALDGEGQGFTRAGAKAGWVLLFGRRRAGISVAHGDEPHASIRMRRGAVTRHLVLMPIVRAQSVLLHRPPVHYGLGLATITLHTVPGPVSVTMRGLGLEDARAWWDYLAVTMVRVQRGDTQGERHDS